MYGYTVFFFWIAIPQKKTLTQIEFVYDKKLLCYYYLFPNIFFKNLNNWNDKNIKVISRYCYCLIN